MTLDPTTCNLGTGVYSPGQNDGRNLVVLFKDETMSSWEPIPSQKINFVPLAFEAKQIQGFTADSIFKVVDGSGNPQLGISPLSNAQYNALLALSNGTSTAYTPAGQLNGSPMPAMTSGQVLGWNGTSWVSTSATPAANSVTSTMLQSSSVTTSAIANNVSINTSGTVGAAITTTRDFKIYAASPSTFAIDMQAPALTASYSLVWPLTAGAANQVLTTDGSGNLSWAPPANSSQWATNGPNISYVAGNVGIGTTNPSSAFSIQNSLTPTSNFNTTTASQLQINDSPTATAAGLYASEYITNQPTITANSSAQNTGLLIDISTPNTAYNANSARGLYINNGFAGTGTLSDETGIYLTEGNTSSGVVSGQSGIYVNVGNSASGTVTTSAAVTGTSINNGTGTMTTSTGGSFTGRNQSPTTMTNAYGTYSKCMNNGSGNITSCVGAYNQGQNSSSGVVASSYGSFNMAYNSGVGTTTTGYGSYNVVTTAAGAITNGYGVYIGAIGATNKFSLYASDVTAPSYFAGNVGVGTTAPTAKLNLAPGSATAGTAPLKFTTGPLLTTPEDGAMEYLAGSGLNFTIGSTRYVIPTNTTAGNYSGVSNISNSGGSITLAPAASSGTVYINSGTVSTGTSSGALTVSGGVGVSGDIYAGATINAGTTVNAATSVVTPQIYGSSAASGNIKIDGTSNATKGNVLLASAGGKVGIGTTAPTAGLEVDSNLTSSSGIDYGAKVLPTVNASGTEGYTGLLVNVAETVVGSGTNNLIDLQKSGTSQLRVDSTGTIISASGNFVGSGGSVGFAPGVANNARMTISGSQISMGNMVNDANASHVRLGWSTYSDINLTASTEAPEIYFNMGGTRTHLNGALPLQRDLRVTPSTHAFSSASTLTDAAGLSVDGPVPAGANATITNSHGIYVPTSSVSGGGSVTNSYGLTINAATGATNNYAAEFLGGNVGIGTDAPAMPLQIASSNYGGVGQGGAAIRLQNLTGNGGSTSEIQFAGSSGSLYGSLTGQYTAYGGNTQGDISINTRVNQSDANLTQQVMVKTYGWVGINTSTPAGRLDVEGTGGVILNAGNVGIGTTAPTARLNVAAGTATLAPLKLTSSGSGVLLSTPQDGAMEYDGTGLWFTIGSTRFAIPTNTSSGNYSSVSNISNSGGSITLAPAASSGTVYVNSGTLSTGTSSGALTVSGGVGVSGDIYAGSTINAGTSVSAATSVVTPQIYGSSAASGNIKIDGTSNATKGNVLLASTGGNVGIGTTSPSTTLDVLGSGSTFVDALSIGNTQAVSTGAGAGLIFKTNANGLARIGGFSPDATGASGVLAFSTRGSNTMAERMRVDQSGNVGIGTTAPAYQLDVSGSSNVSGTMKTYDLNVTDAMFITNAIRSNVYNANQLLLANNQIDSQGLLLSAGDSLNLIVDNNNDGTGALNIRKGSQNPATATALMTVLNGGNVGIGTTAPTSPLSVVGAISATGQHLGAAASTIAYSFNGNTNTGFGQAANNEVSASTNAGVRLRISAAGDVGLGGSITNASGAGASMYIQSTGNVGIGTTAPTTMLDVNGGARFRGFIGTADNDTGMFSPSDGQLNFQTNGANRMVIDLSGNVGIGTTAPAQKLDVYGNIAINGTQICTSTGCTSSSDRSLKENIKPLETSLEKVLKLQGVEYDYKDKTKFTDKHQIGVIAQDVETVYPEVVLKDPKTGLRSVAYDHLVAPLIEAVKSLYARVVSVESHQGSQDREIASVKADSIAKDAKIRTLEKQNAEMRAYLCSKDPSAPICK